MILASEILLKIRKHLRMSQLEMSQTIGMSRLNYITKEKSTDLDFGKALSLRQYSNLKKLCKDSTYCTNVLNEVEEKLEIR